MSLHFCLYYSYRQAFNREQSPLAQTPTFRTECVELLAAYLAGIGKRRSKRGGSRALRSFVLAGGEGRKPSQAVRRWGLPAFGAEALPA